MEGKLLISLLVVSMASYAVAIKCNVCAEGGICTDGEMGELQTCPDIFDVVTDQCAKFDGELSGKIAGTLFNFKGVMRNCNPLPENFEAPPLRCFSNSDATAYLRHIIDDLVPDGTSVVDNLDITVTGDMCFCAGDGCNGVDSLKPLLGLILTAGLMHMLLM